MSLKFLTPPSPDTRTFSAPHRVLYVYSARAPRYFPRVPAVTEAPLTDAQAAALEATQNAAHAAARKGNAQ